MVSFISYNNSGNITSFPNAFDRANEVYTLSTGVTGIFNVGAIMLIFIFFGFYAVGSKMAGNKAFLFASFMSLISAFIMTSMSLLDPIWVLLMLVMVGVGMYIVE